MADNKRFEVLYSADAPSAIGPYSQGIKIPATSNLVFCSGAIGVNP